MTLLCKVCSHAERPYINAALFLHEQSYSAIACRYGLTEICLTRHERNHLGLSLELSREIHAIEDYLMYHAEYMLGPRTRIPRMMDALSRLALSTATALECGLLSPDAIQAIRKSLAHHDQLQSSSRRTAQDEEATEAPAVTTALVNRKGNKTMTSVVEQQQTPEDAVRQEFVATQQALAEAQANTQAARDAEDVAGKRLEAARMALPVLDRYSPLVGSPVRVILASSGITINTTLVACYSEGVMHRANTTDTTIAPTFLPWSSIEDILPAYHILQ